MKSAFLRMTAPALLLVSLGQLHAESAANRVIVKFRGHGNASVSRVQALAERRSASDLGSVSKLSNLRSNLAVLRYSTAISAIEAARSLRRDPEVEWAQPDYIMRATVMPKRFARNIMGVMNLPFPIEPPTQPEPPTPPAVDPVYDIAPVLPETPVLDPRIGEAYGLSVTHTTDAWDLQKGNRTIVVADIDTGIDYNHEDLINNLWTNPTPTENDLHGYDFVNNDAMPFDDEGHGTHTAGTIGATGGNGKGVSGVSQAVSIMALKFLGGDGSGTTADAVRAIDYAIAHGARVMSNSWGGPASDLEDNRILEEAVERANVANILFVAAAGNDMGRNNDVKPSYPAAIRKPNMLTVASTDSSDNISKFSNIGPETVHVAAPGSDILSTLPGNKYGSHSGTSMACPHVAGLAALILSDRPELTALQVKQIIMESVDALPALQGKTVTGGRINARAALERARNFGVE